MSNDSDIRTVHWDEDVE